MMQRIFFTFVLLIPFINSYIETIAARDVFNRYFAAAISKGKNYNETILLANKAATISVTRKGVQPSISLLNDLVYSN